MKYEQQIFDNFPSEAELMDVIRTTSTTVWKRELVVRDIENWLNNFNGEVFNPEHERLLALWLLSHFTFYNEDEVKHLCRVVYRDLIHEIVKSIAFSSTSIDDAILHFFEKASIISSEQTSGSGGFIAYFFRQENDLPIKDLFNFSFDNIGDNIENIIVIDDVTLTEGVQGQMNLFWKKARKKYPQKRFFLLTLISSEASCNYLKSTYGVEIITAITLDNRDKCFHNESDVFSSIVDKALIPIFSMFAEHYGNKINIVPALGWGNGQYTFGFFYNTPDNTLPIFWGQVNGWAPILKRYHKNYRNQTYFIDERFI
jgi:hypothetical protein